MSELYNRLKQLCDEKGVKPAAMCKEIGINQNIPTEIKSGRKKGFSADTANKIANYFGVSVGFLLGTEQEKPAAQGDGLSDQDIRLVRWFRSLPLEKQQAILTAQDAPEGLA